MPHTGGSIDNNQGEMGAEVSHLNNTVADHMMGSTPNLQVQHPVAPLDYSVVMNSLLENMTLQNSTYHIPEFNGKSPELKEFLQDVANGAVFVTSTTEPMFIKAVLSKLKGVARESVRDKQFATINDLISHLKKRFAPGKKYQWYFESIINLRMTQREAVNDYHDRLQGLISGARHTLEGKYTKKYGQEKESSIILRPIIECALDAFIRGLPDEISTFVDIRSPADGSEALEYALQAEERLRYTDKSKGLAFSFHVSRRDSIPDRPTSPFSKQMSSLGNPERVSKESQKQPSFEMGNLQNLPTGMFPPPSYNQLLQQYYESLNQSIEALGLGQSASFSGNRMPFTFNPFGAMPQFPMNQNVPWNSLRKSSSRPNSPGPSRDLNSKQTLGSDAAKGQSQQERPTKNTIGSFEQEDKQRTPR